MDGNSFSLSRMILIDAYRKGAMTELRLDGHTSLTGANGAGKTSLLRLIPLFYGESPNKLVQGGGVNQSFVQHYLPHTTSFIVFEYSRRGKGCMVVLHASKSGESVYYRFIDQPFALERFRDENGDLVNGSDLNRHIKKRGEYCSEQITALIDYRAIIQNSVSGNKDHRNLAANFAFVGSDSRLSHVEKIVTGMFSRVTHFRDIKRMIVSCIVDDKNTIKLESSKTAMEDWVKEYRAYTSVMAHAGRMKDFREAYLRHELASKQLVGVHTDFMLLKHAHERSIAQTETLEQEIQAEMQRLEDETNEKQLEISTRHGAAEGQVQFLGKAILDLEAQQVAYEKRGIKDLAALVERIPQLAENLKNKEEREQALLGKSEGLATQYEKMKNGRVEAFHVFEREKNALKEPIRVRAKEEQSQARIASADEWAVIEAEFEEKITEGNEHKDRLSEQVGGLKQAAADPQPARKYVDAKEKAQTELERSEEKHTEAVKAYEEAERAYLTEVSSFETIDTQIEEFKEKARKETEARDRLLSLFDAAPGTLLHFLREFRPHWTQDIARVVPEELLLRTDLVPSLVGGEALSLYGVGLDLSVVDVPRAGDEEGLRQRIEESNRAIERHQRDAKTKEKELETQNGRVQQTKAATEEKNQARIQAEGEVKACKAAKEAAQRELEEDCRQAGYAANQALRTAQEALEKQKAALKTLETNKAQRRRAHDAALNAALEGIESRTGLGIAQINATITEEKSACDRDIGALNQELDAALNAEGVNMASLEALRKEKAGVKSELQKARAGETDVLDWRRWLKMEWASHAEKVKALKEANDQLSQCVNETTQVRSERTARHGELDKVLKQARKDKGDAEKLLRFVNLRREKLARWSADPLALEIEPAPRRSQDTLEAEMDRLLKEIEIEEGKARDTLGVLKRAMYERAGTTPYRFYDTKRLELGPDQESASPFLWLAPMQDWFETANLDARRLLLSQCRNFSSSVHEFHDRLDGFKRKVGTFSKDLQDNMTASTRFRFINSVSVRLTTSFDNLEGWDKIKQLDEAYSNWSGKDTNELPGQAFADAVGEVSTYLQGRHSVDVKLEDLINLEIDIEEKGQARKTVKDEVQLKDASSNGLSYLILCVVFVGLINKIRGKQPVKLVWALDELRDLDLDNVRVLLEMLSDNDIYLVSAFPDPEPEILALLKHRYAIQEGRKLATFKHEAISHV